MNLRLDTLQAGILQEKLKIFPKEIIDRNRIAELYRDLLKNLPVKFQHIPSNYKSVYAQFSIVFENNEVRNQVKSKLSEKGIPSVVYYGISGHLQSGYKYLNYVRGDFPVSEKLSENILSIPMHPYLNSQDIEKITSTNIKHLHKGVYNVKIGIIGRGFVGGAVAHGFSDQTGYSAQIKSLIQIQKKD